MSFKVRDLSISYNTFSSSAQKEVVADTAVKVDKQPGQVGTSQKGMGGATVHGNDWVAGGGKDLGVRNIGDEVGGDSNPFTNVADAQDQWNGFTAFDVNVARAGLERMDDADCGSTGCGTTSGGTDCGSTGCGTTSGGTDCGSTGCGTTSGGTDCGSTGCGTTSGGTDCGSTGCGTTSGSERGGNIYTNDLTREAALQLQLNAQLQKLAMNRF